MSERLCYNARRAQTRFSEIVLADYFHPEEESLDGYRTQARWQRLGRED